MDVLILGLGRIFLKHLDSINRFNNKKIKIVGICDTDKKKIEKIKKIINVKAFTSYTKALEVTKPDTVIILTPSGHHAEHISYAIKRNCNVIVEKPMCLKLSDAEKILSLSKKYKKRVFVVMQNKFNPPVVKLRDDIEKNKLGKIFHASVIVRWKRDQHYYDQAKWRGTWKLDGGVVSNQASHHLDLLRTIMGEPISVFAKSQSHLAKIECEDTALIIFKFKGGKTAIMEATTAMRPKNIEGSISVLGKLGSVKVGGFALNEFSYYNLKKKINISKFKTSPNSVYGFGHYTFYQHVLTSILKNKKSEFEVVEAIKTIKLINAIYRSIEINKEVFFNKSIKSIKLGK